MSKEHRRNTLKAWRRGVVQIVTTCGMLTEGFDYPEIECLVMARPTRSMTLYRQQLGRGTRLAPGKDYCLVLDCTGLSPDHQQISVPAVVPVPDPQGDWAEDDDFERPEQTPERRLIMLDPRSAGRWRWQAIPVERPGLPQIYGTPYDDRRHLFVVPDARSGLHRIVKVVDGVALPPEEGSRPLSETTAIAGKWLVNNAYLPFAARNARHHSEPASEGQVGFVKSLLGLDRFLALRQPISKATAHAIIDYHMLRRAAPIARRALYPPADADLAPASPGWLPKWGCGSGPRLCQSLSSRQCRPACGK
jgi:Helicase conserved C-terminal domain